MSQDRSDLVCLNQTLLDPNGFLALRSRAGVRLKRRASPTGGGGDGGGGGSNARRRTNADDFLARSRGASSNASRRLPDNIARLKAISSSGTWSDAKVFGRSNSTPIEPIVGGGGGGGGGGGDRRTGRTGGGSGGIGGRGVGSSSSSISRRMAEAAAAAGAEAGNGDEDDDDDDDHPPLLDALVPTKRGAQPSSSSSSANGTTPTPKSSSVSWLAAVTPRDQPTSAWAGASSPWMNGSTPQRPEKGWLKRIAATGGSMSSPTGSSSSFSFSGESGATDSPWRAGAMVMNFPPPPQSLLPVFDRELHGFDASAREGERWGELPFLVVETWGGLKEEVLPPGENYMYTAAAVCMYVCVKFSITCM